jgi:hypothetical protein
MQAYSKEFHRDALAACDAGQSTHEVALQFRVSKSWVRRRQPTWAVWADLLRAAVADSR